MNKSCIGKTGAAASFDIEVSQVIGAAVREIVGRHGDIVFGQLITSLARAANSEADSLRKNILLSALNSLLDDHLPQSNAKTPTNC